MSASHTAPTNILQAIQQLSGNDEKQQLADVQAAYDTSHSFAEKAKNLMGYSTSQLEEKNHQGYTPYHLAVSKGKASIAEWLLTKNASIDTKNAADETPLISAVKLEDEKSRARIVQQIMTTARNKLDHGIIGSRPDGNTDYFLTPINQYVSHAPNDEVHNSAACIAAYNGDLSSIQIILQEVRGDNAWLFLNLEYSAKDFSDKDREKNFEEKNKIRIEKFVTWINAKIKEKKLKGITEYFITLRNFAFPPALWIAGLHDEPEIVAWILLKCHQKTGTYMTHQKLFRYKFENYVSRKFFLEKYDGLSECLRDYEYYDYANEKWLTTKPGRDEAVMAYARQMKTDKSPTSIVKTTDDKKDDKKDKPSINSTATTAATVTTATSTVETVPLDVTLQHNTVLNYFDYCKRKKIKPELEEFKRIYQSKTGSDLTLTNFQGETALIVATQMECEAIVVFILEQVKTWILEVSKLGFINYWDKSNFNALTHAAQRNLTDIATALITAKAKINSRWDTSCNIFKEIDDLIKPHNKPDNSSFKNWRERNKWNSYLLLEKEPIYTYPRMTAASNISDTGYYYSFSKPLLIACAHERKDSVQLLLENKADPAYAYDFCVRGAFSKEFSAWFLELPDIKKLKKIPAATTDAKDAKRDEKMAPTPIPVARKHIEDPQTILEVMQKRIEYKKHGDSTNAFDRVAFGRLDKIDATDTDGNTAAHLAAAYDDRNALAWLNRNENSANFNIKNTQGKTPLDVAIDHSHHECILILLKSGRAKVDTYDNEGRTPLINIIDSKFMPVIKLWIVNEILKIVDTWTFNTNKSAYIAYYPKKPTERPQESAICRAAYHKDIYIVTALVTHKSAPVINYDNGENIECLTAFEHWLANNIHDSEFKTSAPFRYFITTDDACLKLAKRNPFYYRSNSIQSTIRIFCPALIIACLVDAPEIAEFLACNVADISIAEEYRNDLAFPIRYDSLFAFYKKVHGLPEDIKSATEQNRTDLGNLIEPAERDGFPIDKAWYDFCRKVAPREGRRVPALLDAKIGTAGLPSAPSANTTIEPVASVVSASVLPLAPAAEILPLAPGGARPNDIMSCFSEVSAASVIPITSQDNKKADAVIVEKNSEMQDKSIAAKESVIVPPLASLIDTKIESSTKSSSALVLSATSSAATANATTVVVCVQPSDEGQPNTPVEKNNSAEQKASDVIETLKSQLTNKTFNELIVLQHSITELQRLITEEFKNRYTAATSVASLSLMASEEGRPVLAPSRSLTHPTSTPSALP